MLSHTLPPFREPRVQWSHVPQRQRDGTFEASMMATALIIIVKIIMNTSSAKQHYPASPATIPLPLPLPLLPPVSSFPGNETSVLFRVYPTHSGQPQGGKVSTLCVVLPRYEWSGALPSPCWSGSERNTCIAEPWHVHKDPEASGGLMMMCDCLPKGLAEMIFLSSCGHCPVQTQSLEPDAAFLPLAWGWYLQKEPTEKQGHQIKAMLTTISVVATLGCQPDYI